MCNVIVQENADKLTQAIKRRQFLNMRNGKIMAEKEGVGERENKQGKKKEKESKVVNELRNASVASTRNLPSYSACTQP